MQIFVKSLRGKIMSLEVSGSDTVAKVKAKIQAQLGVDPQVQKLLFAGKQLEDEATLREYGVVNDSALHLVYRLHSG